MAQEAEFVEAAVNLAGAIRRHYKRSRGWNEEDIHILMYIIKDILHLGITVVSDKFRGRAEADEYADYDDLADVVEKALNKSRQFNGYGLVLAAKHNFGFYPRRRSDESRVEVDEKLINRGVSWSEPFITEVPAERVP